jgi:hypothetical protein
MKQLLEHHTVKRMLQDGIAKGLWTLEDLDRPSPGFKQATEMFSPQFGRDYRPPVWTNPLRDQTEEKPYQF